LSGQQKAGQNAMGMGAGGGAGAHADFAEDNHASQGAFRLVVGGLQMGVFQKGEQARFVLVGVGQPVLQRQGLLINKRSGTDCVQLSIKAAAPHESSCRANFARPQLAALHAGIFKQASHFIDELKGLRALKVRRLELDLLLDLVAVADELRQTRLAFFRVNGIVGCIPIGGQNPGKVLSQHPLGGLGRAVPINMVKRQVLVSGIPEIRIGYGYSFIDMIQLMRLSFFSTTTRSPLFTDWLAVGWEMPSCFDSSTVLIFNSRAAQ
jgi:hypothetical protein